MKKGFVTAYSIVAFMVLAVAVAWFCVSVFSEASRGSEEADRTFTWLCRETAQNSYSLGFMSDAYIERTTSLCQGINTLVAITISSPTETFYAWPAASPALVDRGGGIEIQRSSLFSKVMDAGVDMGANASPAIRVTASLQTLPPSVIFAASRNSFILVFLVLLSSIIVLLAAPSQEAARASKKEEKSEREESSPTLGSGFPSFSLKEGHEDYLGSSAPQTESKGRAARDWLSEDFSPRHEEESLDASPESARAEESLEAAPACDFAEADFASIGDESAQESGGDEAFGQPGRFSHSTGFGRESYLEERLNSELIRAASSERDVSILILRVFGMGRESDEFDGLAKILINMFTYRDLIFEFGEDAEACILPSASLDETMQAAEQLYGIVRDYLAERGLSNKICIGISTRMTRAVPASRMIREADTAARKAEEEERLPIVAFRANPEKYRNYMARSSHEE